MRWRDSAASEERDGKSVAVEERRGRREEKTHSLRHLNLSKLNSDLVPVKDSSVLEVDEGKREVSHETRETKRDDATLPRPRRQKQLLLGPNR